MHGFPKTKDAHFLSGSPHYLIRNKIPFRSICFCLKLYLIVSGQGPNRKYPGR